MISHGIILATKGILSSNVTSIVSKGYLITITIEEGIVYSSSGGAVRLKPVINKKLMKVTVKVKGETFSETQLVDKNVKLTTKDVNVEFNNGGPTVKVNDVNLKDPWFGQSKKK